MDPGLLAFLAMVAPFAASLTGIMTAVGGVHQGIQGHARGDYHGMFYTLLGGAAATGLVYTSPQWVPTAVAALSAVHL